MVFGAVVEVGSHYFSFKFRGDNYFRLNYDKKATEIAKWTKIIGSIGMFFLNSIPINTALKSFFFEQGTWP